MQHSKKTRRYPTYDKVKMGMKKKQQGSKQLILLMSEIYEPITICIYSSQSQNIWHVFLLRKLYWHHIYSLFSISPFHPENYFHPICQLYFLFSSLQYYLTLCLVKCASFSRMGENNRIRLRAYESTANSMCIKVLLEEILECLRGTARKCHESGQQAFQLEPQT